MNRAHAEFGGVVMGKRTYIALAVIAILLCLAMLVALMLTPAESLKESRPVFSADGWISN